MGEQARQSPDRHLVQPLSLAEEPVLERGFLDGEPIQKVTPIERGRVRERRWGALGDPPLELENVHRHGAGLEGHHAAVDIERIVVSPRQTPPQRVERLTQACPRRRLDRAAPEQTRELVSGMCLAGWHGQVGKESLRLSRRKGERSAGIEGGSKATTERQSERATIP